MRRLLGVAPANAADAATKGYVDAPPVATIAYAASITPAVSHSASIAATGSFTLNAPASSGDGMMMLIEVRASAAVTVTFAAAILLTTGQTASLAVTSGHSGFIGLRYSTTAAAWFLLAAAAG